MFGDAAGPPSFAAWPPRSPLRPRLDHDRLAALAREFLLAGHLIDRSGMPHLVGAYGREEMQAIAIEEWMGASPVYTRRMQRALGFAGDTVETIFKGMQLDIGAPPEFMDFRYRVTGDDHGEFWLDTCGALLDVEPMGDEFVTGMCHHIEDPTFEATAAASNPRARMTPVHRPPRRPADRHPHCRWTIDIDPRRDPLPEPAPAVRIAATRAARVEIAPAEPTDDGWSDYTRPLDPDLRLEDFSSGALSIILAEAALQGHLLVLAFLDSVERRHGTEGAVDAGRRQFTGVAGVVASRLVRSFIPDRGPEGFATLLDLHPAFHPREYIDWRVHLDGDRVTAELWPCAALEETGRESWTGLLADGHHAPLDAIVSALDPRARCRPVSPPRGARAAWQVVLDAEPRPEPPEVTLTRFSTGADFAFHRVGPRTPPG